MIPSFIIWAVSKVPKHKYVYTPASKLNSRRTCQNSVAKEDKPTPKPAQIPPNICVYLQPIFFKIIEAIGPKIYNKFLIHS